MNVLVTGASGNVGRYVVEALLNKNENIIAAGTKPQKLVPLFGKSINTVYLDFTDKQSFDQALEGIDRVFLMRPPHLGKPQDLYPFIDSMKAHNIKLVSFLSLMGVENNTIPPHHKIEKYIEKVNLPYAHIRPSFFMQNLSGVHSVEIREHDEIFIPAGKSKTSFIDAADIGLAAATLLSSPHDYKNTSHTITGPEALDYYEVAEILTQELGRKITYANPGFLRYRKYYVKKRKLNKNYVNVTIALYFMTRMGTAKKVTNDFYTLTGKKTRSMRDFIKDHVNEFQKDEQ